MGHSWNKCVHDRPIGIKSCTGIGKAIRINPKCIWDDTTSDNHPHLDDSPNYVHLGNDIYEFNDTYRPKFQSLQFNNGKWEAKRNNKG